MNLKIMYLNKQSVISVHNFWTTSNAAFSSKSLFLCICCTQEYLGAIVKQYVHQFVWKWGVKKRRPPIFILPDHYNWRLSLSFLSSAQNLFKNHSAFFCQNTNAKPQNDCCTWEASEPSELNTGLKTYWFPLEKQGVTQQRKEKKKSSQQNVCQTYKHLSGMLCHNTDPLMG